MNKKNISPKPQQPVDRVPAGQLPTALAELSEESLGSLALASSLAPKELLGEIWSERCSYDGDDE